jgi:hypothetical protein
MEKDKEKDHVLPTNKVGLPNRRNPLFMNHQGLPFDNIPEEIVTKRTDKQEADRFLTKYMQIVDPIITYQEYFDSTAKSIEYIFREIKVYYQKLVLNANWTERKYVAVINNIFENRMVFGVIALDRAGLLYDKGQLDTKSQPKRVERRRRI